MPKTSADKLKLAKEEIASLSEDYQCRSFHGGVLKCSCIMDLQGNIVTVKAFFTNEVEEFWDVKIHYDHRTDRNVIGVFLGEYLYPYFTSQHERSGCKFKIGQDEHEFCLSTITRIFGLGQHAFTKARSVLVNKKSFGLNILKKGCEFDLLNSKDEEHQKLNYLFNKWFNYKVVPMSLKSPRAISLIENIGGIMLELTNESLASIDFIFANYHPSFEDVVGVTNGGENIRYAPPGNGLARQKTFDTVEELKPFIDQVKPAVISMWKKLHMDEFEYETLFLFSTLSGERDNIPQLAHCDLQSTSTAFEKLHFKSQSMIGFTPINEDGMMIMVWTEGNHKKFRSNEEKLEDRKRKLDEEDVCPGQYFLYIPRGIFVAIPGDTIHAGGFCFGKKLPCPTKKSGKKEAKVEYFQNQRLHFTFPMTNMTLEDAEGDDTILIVTDDRPRFKNDFLPDEDTMAILFKNLLDHHPNFDSKDEPPTSKNTK